MGQVTGQVEELKSTVDDISSKVRRRDTILSSRGATGSRVRDQSFKVWIGGVEIQARSVGLHSGIFN